VFPVGIEDFPAEHAQRVLTVDVEMDNVMVVATAQRGKSTTLMTLITAAALMYRPERVAFLCIGASLFPVEEIPHVAGVVSLSDSEGCSRVLATVEGVIKGREAAFKRHQVDIAQFRERRLEAGGELLSDPDDRFGDLFLVIDNFGDLYEKSPALGDRVIAVARQGLSYGVHVVSSASGWLVGQKQALLNVSNARVQLRLSNPEETQMGTGIEHRRAARNTLDRPGFGVTRRGQELLIGRPVITGPNGELIETRSVGAALVTRTGLQKPAPLVRLPECISMAEVSTAYQRRPNRPDALEIPFAIGESRLQPITLAASASANLLVVGRQGCGKTSCLAAIGQSIADHIPADRAQITIIDPKTSLIGKVRGQHVRTYAYTPDEIDRVIGELADLLRDRLPPAGLNQEELLAMTAWSGPHQFLLIDDEQELRQASGTFMQAATAPLWPLIERSRQIGLHVICSRLPGNWAGVSAMSPFLQRLAGSRAPTLFMDNDPQTVKVFGRISAQQLAPGRGLFVSPEGVTEGVLVGTPRDGG
jgi:type VII secretion protein EccCb